MWFPFVLIIIIGIGVIIWVWRAIRSASPSPTPSPVEEPTCDPWFEESPWNDPGAVELNNCYRYACNMPAAPTQGFATPSLAGGRTFDDTTCVGLRAAVIRDGLIDATGPRDNDPPTDYGCRPPNRSCSAALPDPELHQKRTSPDYVPVPDLPDVEFPVTPGKHPEPFHLMRRDSDWTSGPKRTGRTWPPGSTATGAKSMIPPFLEPSIRSTSFAGFSGSARAGSGSPRSASAVAQPWVVPSRRCGQLYEQAYYCRTRS